MKTEIQIFTSEVFGEIRTCQVNNQIMFVGKDVATALGYAKPQNALATHVDREDKSTAPIQGTAYETRVKVTGGQARCYKQTTDLQLYYRERRNDILREAKQYGASIRQLVRLTGISFAIVRDA